MCLAACLSFMLCGQSYKREELYLLGGSQCHFHIISGPLSLVFAMAEAGISGLGSSNPQFPKPAEHSLPRLGLQGSILDQIDPAGSLEGCREPGASCVFMGAVPSTPVEDDDVQFIFAAPRRRKKKRKR